ncbi:glycoside hydrolase family 16 protein [Prevotella sp. A2931]|uniref:Glycoside hydrolase family 16 protein n=1 Tax=Prevotella illustrans TaxID=2800387 RepID=A0ABS3M7M8_9BACT|nr:MULTISPECIES: glycoside hydrolase family 16 protein [Prevotella]MBO1364116.1 glycoside hydrolase family 16 protein [Prevotella illustrans]PTL26050.1 glycoside hydrolase [Prevotella sp. oral taxon 820]
MYDKFPKTFLSLLIFPLLGSCSTFFTTGSKREKVPNGRNQQTIQARYRLVWHDEFDYAGLPDSTRWSFETRGNQSGWGNNELQHYTESRLQNASVSNGCLRITARKEDYENKRYTSARLTTKGHAQWLYGRMECRAKLPVGRGTWPAFWMMPSENTYGIWPASGEIDIMENVGFDPDKILATTHTQQFNHIKGTSVSGTILVPTCNTEFHVYAVEWDEREIRGYVDGHHYYTYANQKKGWESWPFDKPFHIILNLAIGGDWGGKMGVDDTIFPCSYVIDYVRVYQQM